MTFQYTAWLRRQRHGNEVVVSRDWLLVEGHSLFPSDVGEYLSHLPDFAVDGPTIQVSREELLQAIRHSLAEAA